MSRSKTQRNRTQIYRKRQSLRAGHFAKQSGKCLYCNCDMENTANHRNNGNICSLEHIVPRLLGGQDTELNTISVCVSCNCGRGHDVLSDRQIMAILRYKGIPGIVPVATVLYHEFIAWGARQLFTTSVLVGTRIPV